METIEEIEKERIRKKEVLETRAKITSFACPVCGTSLISFIDEPSEDRLEFRAHIFCPKCTMFHAASSVHSNYDKGNPENDAYIEVANKVEPYIKKHLTEEDFEQ